MSHYLGQVKDDSVVRLECLSDWIIRSIGNYDEWTMNVVERKGSPVSSESCSVITCGEEEFGIQILDKGIYEVIVTHESKPAEIAYFMHSQVDEVIEWLDELINECSPYED